jgi:S-adenosylmethionine hydrolase
VFLLTDFGATDEFAGVLRAVVLREAPGCPVVDLTHEIPPFDVRAGALALERAVPHLGPGVVVAVVDPGVGTERRAVAVEVAGEVASSRGPRFLVSPDNGLIGFAMDLLGGVIGSVALLRATARPATGSTFDGRDVFAPAAARLWAGRRLEDLGVPIDPGTLTRLEAPRLEVRKGEVEAEVLWVDRFGNVQLAARPADAEAAELVSEPVVVSGHVSAGARRSTSFAGDPVGGRAVRPGTAASGALRLIVDSNGRLAVVCPQSSAAAVLRVSAGDTVSVRNGDVP